MHRRWLRSLSCSLGLSLFVLGALSACGGGEMPPPMAVDAGDRDAGDAGPGDGGPRDAAPLDLGEVDLGGCPDEDGDGHGTSSCGDDCDDTDATRYPGATEVCDLDDEDCNDATYGADADADGFQSSACCNGASNCGADCDDALNTVNPGAAEQCNGGLDDDCDGLADSADGVCAPCPAGYAGFDGDCTNIDECAETAPCGGAVGAACTDTLGSYVCTCPVGYTGSVTGGTCFDVDECATSAPCGVLSTACTNTPGSYVCACATGYTAPATGGACTDTDECATASTCGGGRAGCTNTAGSYVCICAAGYAAPATGGACADVNECTTGAPCGVLATACTNTVGSYICTCAGGYGAPANGGTCADIDECTAGTCTVNATSCANTVGSYACTCALGYSAPAMGGPCADVDECAVAATCGAQRAGCVNSSGSYACTCAAGYSAPGGTCIDVDECAVAATCGAQRAGCVNSVGSYACTCNAGYVAPATGGTCADIDECMVAATCGAQRAGCVNSVGSYACTCAPGYSAPATGGTCTDVNECVLGTDDCENVVATCANTVGSFTCACTAGFVGTGHRAGSCLWNDPSLASLTPGAGATLGPTFSPGTTMYTVALPPGTTSVTLTPSVAYPTRATLTVDGVTVASGAASAPISRPVGLAPQPVLITVTTESATTRTYTVVVGRGSNYVKASNTGAGDWFGYAVALSADGSTLAVGAWGEDSNATGLGGDLTNNTASDAGAVYVFTRAGTTWSQQAYVKASNTGVLDRFGGAVALSSDGSTLAVGARGEDSNATGVGGDQTNNTASDAGAVYVFTRTGTTWSQQAYVKASNTGVGDNFGHAIALSSDGSTLAVGAYGEASSATGVGGDQTNDTAGYAGAVYVFTRAGTTWSQQAYVKASNTASGDFFGSVALSSDGSTLAVGAFGEDSNATGIGGDQTNDAATDAGAVYVFTRVGAIWSQQAYVKASNTGVGDNFGYAIALSWDGSTLAVGAFGEDSSATGLDGDQTNDAASDAGAVYVFTRAGITWSQRAYVKASNTGALDRFGWGVALSADGSTLSVGARDEDSSATGIGGDQTNNTAVGSGAVHVFTRAGTGWSQQAYVKASNTGVGDNFGHAIALSGDGSTLVVGAWYEDSNATGVGGDQTNNAAADSGAVYVY